MSAKHFLAVLFILLAPAVAQAAGKLPVKTVKTSDHKPTYEVELAYPRTGHAAIDQAIETWAKDVAKDFVDGVTSGETTSATGKQAMELSFEVQRNDGRMFAVLFSTYSYTGGAHPNSVYEAFTFLLPDGARVEIADLFTRKGIERISALSIAQLTKDIGGPDGMTDTDWIKRGAGPNARNFSNFALKATELALYFDAYQVAAYAAGPQEVHIPLAKLKGMLRPNPRAPAASFDCAKAGGDVEQAICGNRDLARLDRHVAEAYFDKLSWAADDLTRYALRHNQREWLLKRDQCRVRAESFDGCLTRVHQERLKALRASP
jgi:uncharacterized protein YecT (DUF1311 family)